MNYSVLGKVTVHFTAIAGTFLCLFLFIKAGFAANCEIEEYDPYKSEQNVLATDWKDGIPYTRYTTEVYQCAAITFKNTFWQAVYSTDFEITATFEDRSVRSKRTNCDKRLLEPDDTYSCSLCFETSSPISHLESDLR